jgi:hypothetical protein
MLANTHKSRLEQSNEFRNKALLAALDAVLKLADPDCKDVMINCLAADGGEAERQWRSEQAAYLNSWVIGPLADALRQKNLPGYANTASVKAGQFLEDLDALGI